MTRCEPALRLQVQQRLLDRAQRHRAVHRVFRHRECFDVERLRAGQHHAVVVRLVAVAVDDRDVARRQQRLHGHLVRRGGAVGDEEDVIGAEGARRHLLRLLDVAGRLQQAVEAAGGGAAFGQEQVEAVEFAHVANPVGLENRLAARDRQRVEGADRPLRVFLQIVEERRLEALLHALEDGQVQLEQFLDRVEDAPRRVRIRIAGDLLDPSVQYEVEIELRPHALQHLRQVQCRHLGALFLVGGLDKRPQYRRIVPRSEREAFVDDDGGEIRVEHCRAECVLEAADEDRLVDERIQRPAQPAPLRGKSRPARGRRAGDDQDLEIRPMGIRAPKRRRQYIRRHALVILVRVPIAGVLAERSGEHGAGDATAKRCGRGRIIGRGMIAQGGQQPEAGIGMEFLGRRHLGERRLEFLPVAGAAGPGLRHFHQISPLIGARSGTCKKSIDANGMRAGSL